ncbi:TPA: pLS20_p028 family conjugation system transmembrane protein, partial [Enterococcus faecium]
MTESINWRKLNVRWLKYKWPIIVSLIIILFVSYPQQVFALPWITDNKEVLNFLTKYQDYLQFTKGGFGSIVMQSLSWGLIRGAYFVCKSAENLVPQSLSLFSFVESSSLGAVYQSVLNTVVVGLMILSLMFVGYKMITGKGTVDLKSVGMNVVMSVALILLMPTMISSGIQFAKTFYKDSTTITKADGGVAWSLIEDGVTDLVYINKNDAYDRLGKDGVQKNALKEKNFFSYDFSEVITVDTAKDLEDDNKKAEYLQSRLTPDGEGNMQAVKIDDGWMSMFSDSFKGGYYRFTKNTFALTLGLLSLAVAYVFSIFIIVTAILELAFKRVL